jgi:plastocyanin
MIEAAWRGAGAPHTATFIAGDPDEYRAANDVFIPEVPVGLGDDGDVIGNPAVFGPSDPTCGAVDNPCEFNGTDPVNSGVQFSSLGSQPSFFAEVTAPAGEYSVICLLHPGMQAGLTVAADDETIPSPADVAATAAQQVQRAKTKHGPRADAEAQIVTATRVGGGITRYTMNAGGFFKQVSANEFPAAGIAMEKGDRLRVVGVPEIHTATFPADSIETVPFIITQCEVAGPDTPAASPADCAAPQDFQAALNPQAVAPTASNLLRNPERFVNSGLFVGDASYTFEAKKSGVYTMVCLVHGAGQATTVTVG